MHKRAKLAPHGGATPCAATRGAGRAALICAALLALAWSLPALAEPAVEITIDNFTFTPATITIEPGTIVKWINRDDIPHSVVAKSLAFRSKALDTEDSFSHEFNELGESDYFCSLHPHMTGKIIVRGNKGSPSP
jgi:plastocyanin